MCSRDVGAEERSGGAPNGVPFRVRMGIGLECWRAVVAVAGLAATEVWNWRRHWCTPPEYRFMHNLPNKPLSSRLICKILKTNRIIRKIFKTLELWSLWSLGRHKPEAGGFCLCLVNCTLRVKGVRPEWQWDIRG